MSNAQDVIVVGVDGSPASDRALEWAMQEGQRRRCAVEVVTAFGHGTHLGSLAESTLTAEARQKAESIQARQIARIAEPYRADVPLAAQVVEGTAVERLVEAARHASLLVVGSHGYGLVHQVLVGSVAAGCIRRAACPVVVLPARQLEPLESHAVQAQTVQSAGSAPS